MVVSFAVPTMALTNTYKSDGGVYADAHKQDYAYACSVRAGSNSATANMTYQGSYLILCKAAMKLYNADNKVYHTKTNDNGGVREASATVSGLTFTYNSTIISGTIHNVTGTFYINGEQVSYLYLA